MKYSMGRVAAVCLLTALTACGGGGGGGSTGSGVQPTPTTSGLVPAAPVLGATLYADAGTLRPLQAGSVWTYQGTASAYAGAVPTVYQTTTTQAAGTAGATIESTNNSGNSGADSQTVSLAAGQIIQSQSVDFTGKGVPQKFNFIELRSPVRTGDQYVSLDQRYTDTAIDADRDGKPDALDVAIYSRVGALETVTPPNLPALRGVRVETVFATRVTYSSNAQTSPVVTIGQSTWYAAGIGIVRQTTTSPTASGTDTTTTDELITAWDGISTGLGAMPSVPAVIPAGSGVFPGQTLPGGVAQLLAFAFSDHALLLGDAPGSVFDSVASRIDLRGNVLGTTLLQGLRVGYGAATADANGVVLLEPRGSGAVTQYDMTRIDANGALVGTVRGRTITAFGGSHVSAFVTRLTAAVDGSTLWLLWGRSYYDPGNGNVPGTELVLRPFGLDGVPLGPEVLVDNTDGSGLALAASGGKVLLSWVRPSPGYDVRFGGATLGGTLQTRTLASGLTASNSFVTLLNLGSGGAMLWPALLGSGQSVGAAGGVKFGADLQVVRAGSSLLDEQIPALPPFYSDTPGPTALGSRIVVTTTESRKLLPTDAFTQPVDAVNWLETGDLPLAQTPVYSVRYPSRAAKRHAVFSDRVLVFSGTTGLTTTVVWLNRGS